MPETTQIAAEFQALPLEFLIAAPLLGAVKAQSVAADATKAFIESMLEKGKPITVDFQVEQHAGSKEKGITVQAPLLALVPVPHLRIDSITSTFHFEITQTYSLIVPLMLCAVLSVIVGRLFYRESVYTAELAAAGIRVGGSTDLTLLRQLTVRDVPLMPPVTVRPDDSGQRLLDLSERFAVSDFVVVDEQDNYLGMVTGADLQAALVFREAIPLLQVNEIERTDLPSMVLDDTLDVALDRFSEHDAASLAVLSRPGDGQVIGVLTRSRLMREYQHALAES